MCYGIIYKIENKINGKIYIGQTTTSFDERYRGDIRNTHNEHLKRSIEKYGVENFDIDKCVCECETKEELDRVEQFYIYVYNTMDQKNGYNKREGGNGGKLSEETKDKIEKALADPEIKKKQSESIRKAWEDPEVKKRHKEGARKAYENPEYKEKLRESARKACENPEYKEKLSKNIRKALADPEVKKRQKEGIRKAYENPEYKEKLRESARKALADPEVRRKRSESLKKALSNPETKRKQSESAKKAWENPERRENISKKLSGKNSYRARSVIQLDIQNNFIRKWDYIGKVTKELNIAHSSISNCCGGHRKSSGGYKWIYLEDYLDLLQYAF